MVFRNSSKLRTALNGVVSQSKTLEWLRGAAMHRNCHLDRAFSLLPRRRLGRMNAADRPTNGLVDSQTSDVGSIRIARSITLMIRLALHGRAT